MRQVTIDALRKGLTHELDDLPFEIVKRGKVVAEVMEPLDEDELSIIIDLSKSAQASGKMGSNAMGD